MKGKEIHEEVVNRGFLEGNVMLGNALVAMYAKCGVLAAAQQVLEELPVRDVVSWNSLISGYSQHEQGQEALNCFALMQRECISPNEVTFLCILKACSCVGAVHKGKQIHDLISNSGFLQKNLMLGTTLVDMYAKCGALTKAQQVLKDLPTRDLVSWSALITGYAQEGQAHKALACFEGMQSEGLSPDAIAFLSALNACSHSGKLTEVQSYYEIMSTQFGIDPKSEHHSCLVVGFGCAGHFDEAMSLMRTMPASNDPKVWLALLGTCKKWANVKLGRWAFDQATQIDNNLAAAYILMSNIYAAAGMQEDAEKIEQLRVKTETQSERGTWISAKQKHSLISPK
jgi:pentatricopeptide repeat protein